MSSILIKSKEVIGYYMIATYLSNNKALVAGDNNFKNECLKNEE